MGQYMRKELLIIDAFMHNNRYVAPARRLPYFVNWDGIMPVVIKCLNSYHDMREDIFSALHNCDLLGVQLACLNFIKWYNDSIETNEDLKNYDPAKSTNGLYPRSTPIRAARYMKQIK